MPRFLRLQNTVIHVPSVSNVSMGTTCFGKPYMSITFHHTAKTVCLSYKTWQTCESQFNTVKDAMKEIDTLLSSVPLTISEVDNLPVNINVPVNVKEEIKVVDIVPPTVPSVVTATAQEKESE